VLSAYLILCHADHQTNLKENEPSLKKLQNGFSYLSKKWGMLKVYNCIDFSVHPCIALSSDTFGIGKKLYITLLYKKKA
jgi:hypothetical protein